MFGLKTNLSHSPFILSYTIRIRKHKSTARKVKVFTTRVSSGYVYVYGWSPVAILADYVFSFQFQFSHVIRVTTQSALSCVWKPAGATTTGSGSLSWPPCWGPCWAPGCMPCLSTGICPGPGRTSLTTPWSSQTSPTLGRDDQQTSRRMERIWPRSGWIEDKLSVHIGGKSAKKKLVQCSWFCFSCTPFKHCTTAKVSFNRQLSANMS